MSKNLTVIQSIAKVARIVLNVIYIFSIVCGAISLLGAVASLGLPVLKISDANIELTLQELGFESEHAVLDCIFVAIDCAVVAVIFGFAVRYLKNELKAGTPFTYEGARELLILGIVGAALPVASDIIKSGAIGIYGAILKIEASSIAVSEQPLSSIIGLLLIAVSFVLKYGAEITSKQNTEA